MPNIHKHPLHLGLGATAIIQSEFTGALDWYEAYSARNAADGAEGRLVTMHSFSQSWDSWEMHPHGDEVVLCVAGHITLHLPGAWHTADIEGEATALFITAGLGTQHRPR